jgi:hypothetical protein
MLVLRESPAQYAPFGLLAGQVNWPVVWLKVGTCATAIAAEAAMMTAVYFILTLVQVQDVVAGKDCSREVDGSERLMF